MIEQGCPTRDGAVRAIKGLVVVLALALALFAPPWAAAKPKPPLPPPIPVEFVDAWDPNAADGLAGISQEVRAKYRISPGKAVGVFRVHLPDGRVKVIVLESIQFSRKDSRRPWWIEGHVERRLVDVLNRMGWKRSWVGAGYIDFEPCELNGHFCRRLMARNFPDLGRIFAGNRYPKDKAARKPITAGFRRQVTGYYRVLDSTNGLMTPPRAQPGPSPLRQRLALPPAVGRPGGIDFSSLELRYVSDQGPEQGVGYAFRGAPDATASDPAVGLQTADQSSDAFFTWLALPPSTHWVNLNPNEPDRIFDPRFGRTDAGRVLLEADLAMKKSFARAMHPDTPSGAAFWQEFDALYDNRPDGNYCFSFRQEIEPAPATVRESGGELFILDAPLQIEVEAQHFPGYTPCSREEALDPRKEEMYRRLVAPVVVQAINTEPQYAALRRVYLARVAAEWFRRRSAQNRTAVSPIIDSGTVDPWALNPPYDPKPVFDEMVRSLTQGEFVVQRPKNTGGVEWIRVYSFGGVDFSAAPRRRVGAREFKANYPRLARQARQARRRQAASDTEVWLGGRGDVAPADIVLHRPDLLVNVRSSRARAQAGQQVTYRLRATNTTKRRMSDVRVCDRMPAELRFVRSSRRAQIRNGHHCWRIPRIGARRSTTIAVTAQVLSSARGRVRYRATAAAAAVSVAGSSAQRTITVGAGSQPRPGGVTG
jgi:uncharacterized repeat protein (TIGR01451 family)